MSYLNEKVVIEGRTTPHDPISMVRAIADTVENFWGPVAAQFGDPTRRPTEDDPYLKSSRDDATCLRAVADLMEANRARPE